MKNQRNFVISLHSIAKEAINKVDKAINNINLIHPQNKALDIESTLIDVKYDIEDMMAILTYNAEEIFKIMEKHNITYRNLQKN